MKKVMKRLFLLAVISSLAFSGCKKEEPRPDEGGGSAEEETVAPEADAKEEIRVIDGSENIAAEENPVKKDFLIAIDPGHQSWDVDMSAQEPNAPGSEEMKERATSGTAGAYSGVPEYQLNLDVSLKLQEALTERGYEVILTREDNQTAISNSERAVLANNAGADISIRIHANGSEDPSVSGALALVMSPENPYTGSLYEKSYALAESVLNSYCQRTGFDNLGIQYNDTMTGINWSQVPVMILEMGFMTSEHDDLQMADAVFQEQMVAGIADGIERYYEQERGQKSQSLEELETQIASWVQERTDLGESWAVYAKDLSGGRYASVGEAQMESASLIKLFTAVTVFVHMDEVKMLEDYEGETLDLMGKMIRASDNDASNTLVERLGGGDAVLGMDKVNQFCQGQGYLNTHMGRLMLDFEAADDNYTSAADVGRLLESLYKGEAEGADTILSFMREQERTEKIPAGLPSGVVCANKTGELDHVENDAAVVYTGTGDYILCVMSASLTDARSAREKIAEISSGVYEYMGRQSL